MIQKSDTDDDLSIAIPIKKADEFLQIYYIYGSFLLYEVLFDTGKPFHAEKLSHQSFIKNEMEFLLNVYTYHLFHMFLYEVLEGKDKQITMETYQKEVQKVTVK